MMLLSVLFFPSIVDHQIRIVLANIIADRSLLHLFGLWQNGYFDSAISEAASHHELSLARSHSQLSIIFYLMDFIGAHK